jgi:transposase
MTIRRLRAEGLSITEIARRLGRDRKTVRVTLQRGGPPRGGRRGGRTKFEKLQAHRGYLERRLGEGVFNCAVLFDELRERGYTGGMTVLKQFVRPYRPPRAVIPVIRFETEPGYQAQVDFFDILFLLPDGSTWKVYLFLYVLSYSRYLWGTFLPSEQRVQFFRGLDAAFRATGGVPTTLLHDRLSAAVIGSDEEHRAVYAPEFLAFARHYGFQPQACRARRAQTKGKVERPGRYVQENFLPRVAPILTARDFGFLNRSLAHWCDTIANVRVHGTTHERPIDRFLRDEAEQLHPLPAFAVGLDEIASRRVGRDCLVRWKSSWYRLPVEFAGRSVLVRETPEGTVHIEFQGRLVKSYPLAQAAHSVADDPALLPAIWEAALGAKTITLTAAPPTEEPSLDEYERYAGLRP